MKNKKQAEPEKENGERWLLTYADMITLLLALFVVLYAISSVDAQKYAAIKDGLTSAFGGNTGAGGGTGAYGEGQVPRSPADPANAGQGGAGHNFSDLYEALLADVKEKGYSDSIDVIQEEDSIVVRFKDSVLFYPDSPAILPEGYAVLANVGNILRDMGDTVGKIQIEGHTAYIGEAADASFVAWTLSSDRAIAVLKYLNVENGIEQSKMNVAGYSHFVPIAQNDTEAGRAKNRRVELRITPP